LANLDHTNLGAIRAVDTNPTEELMPRQKSLITVIRDLVQEEVRSAMNSLFSTVTRKKPAKNGRRKRRRRRGVGRPKGSKNKTA
jgi:hypothetical protein